jgi:hypothetical protein
MVLTVYGWQRRSMGTKRVISAGLLVAAAVLGLSGCSLFPEPPDELLAAAATYADEVRELPGVEAAKASVEEVDRKDRLGEWRVRLVVDAIAADGLMTVPIAVTAVQPPPDVELLVTVRVPAAPGLAPVDLTNALEADLERAATLRALPFAAAVHSDNGFSIDLLAGTRLKLAVSTVHESGVLASDPLDHIRLVAKNLSVDVSATGPSAELAALVDDLGGDSTVQRVYATEAGPYSARPRLTVYLDNPSSLVDAVTALREPTVAGRPTTEFLLSDRDEEVRGFVGLPLGSAEPDDLPRPEPAPTADPAVVAAQLASDAAHIVEFLTGTADSAGVPGAPTTVESGCVAPATSQVWGSLRLAVFDYSDSAEPAYDAIVAAWEAAGYTHTDQAAGTAIYTSSDDRAVGQLTIRGTSEGIEISAWGMCRG